MIKIHGHEQVSWRSFAGPMGLDANDDSSNLFTDSKSL